MHAVIVANGVLESNAKLRELWERGDLRIAADGGARNVREHFSLAPQVVIGDFDSLDRETKAWLDRQHIEFIQYPPAKNETDLELALNLARERGAENVTLLGAFDGRIDQFIANVLLLTRGQQVVIADAASEIWAGTKHATIEGTIGDTVSLIPIDERVEGIETSGLEYPLREEDLARGSTRGISNVLTANRAEVKWRKGLLLVVHLFGQL